MFEIKKKLKKRLSLFQKPGNLTSKFGCPDKCFVVHWEIESHGVGACVGLTCSSKCVPGISFVEFWVQVLAFSKLKGVFDLHRKLHANFPM